MRINRGGSYAPPLTDELLADYRRQIDAVPERTQLRDALETLYRCCLAWWQQPESTGPGRPNPLGPVMSVGGVERKSAPLVDLDPGIVTALWADVPWPAECEQLKQFCDTIEKDEDLRNTAKLEPWRKAVGDLLFSKAGFACSAATLSTFFRTRKLLGRIVSASRADAAARFLFPDVDSDADAKYSKWQDSLAAAIADGGSPPLPRPTLEPTPLRYLATHLLWHADILAQDIEPLTQDKL